MFTIALLQGRYHCPGVYALKFSVCYDDSNCRHHVSLLSLDYVTLLPLASEGLISKPHSTTRSADKSLNSYESGLAFSQTDLKEESINKAQQQIMQHFEDVA